MAALLLVQLSLHSNHTNNNNLFQLLQRRPSTSRTTKLICCRSHDLPASINYERPMKHDKGGDDGKEEKKKKLEVGRILKESLMSPKQKGDWKDLVLMSLSFAVYVYISQRIVCTYCAWISILKHSF